MKKRSISPHIIVLILTILFPWFSQSVYAQGGTPWYDVVNAQEHDGYLKLFTGNRGEPDSSLDQQANGIMEEHRTELSFNSAGNINNGGSSDSYYFANDAGTCTCSSRIVGSKVAELEGVEFVGVGVFVKTKENLVVEGHNGALFKVKDKPNIIYMADQDGFRTLANWPRGKYYNRIDLSDGNFNLQTLHPDVSKMPERSMNEFIELINNPANPLRGPLPSRDALELVEEAKQIFQSTTRLAIKKFNRGDIDATTLKSSIENMDNVIDCLGL